MILKQRRQDLGNFLTADYAFGAQLQDAAARVVTANGGKVLGAVRVPSIRRISPRISCRRRIRARKCRYSPMLAPTSPTR